MTSDLLTVITEITIQASILVAAVMLVRLACGKKLDKRLQYYLWVPVALRLLIPYSIQSKYSVMNLFRDVTHKDISDLYLAGNTGIKDVVVNGRDVIEYGKPAYNSVNPVLLIWLAGIALVAVFTLVNNIRLRKCLRKGCRAYDADCAVITRQAQELCDQMGMKTTPRIYISEYASSPCAVGIINPSIYLPTWATESSEDLRYILMHELTHIRRHDNLMTFFISLCCIIYWFNPLVWVMGHFSRTDREYACDAQVIKGLCNSEKKTYGMVLITALQKQSVRTSYTFASPMASKKDEMCKRLSTLGKSRSSSKIVSALVAAFMTFIFILAGTTAKTAKALIAFDENTGGEVSTTLALNNPDMVDRLGDSVAMKKYWVRMCDSSVEADSNSYMMIKIKNYKGDGVERLVRVTFSGPKGAVYVSDGYYNKLNPGYRRMSYSDRDAFIGLLEEIIKKASVE